MPEPVITTKNAVTAHACATRFGYADSSASRACGVFCQRDRCDILLWRDKKLQEELVAQSLEDRTNATIRTRILLRRICDARGRIVWHRES